MRPEQLNFRRPNGGQQGTITFDLEFKAMAVPPPNCDGQNHSISVAAERADDNDRLEPRTPTGTDLPAVVVDDVAAEIALEEAIDDGTAINTAGTLVLTDLEVRHIVAISFRFCIDSCVSEFP